MATSDPLGCEPLRVWNRLEPRARQVDFDGALQAKIHDPLWMLTRQWQFGEFKGEDTGSAILAKLARRITPVAGVRVGGQAFETYDQALPLEARVERMPIDWSPVARASSGRHFMRLLDAAAAGLGGTAAPYDPKIYAALFARVFPIAIEALDETDPVNALAVARRRAQARAQRIVLALASRLIDGLALAEALQPAITWSSLPGELAIGVHPDHQTIVLEALSAFAAWFARLHVIPPSADATAWTPAQLEYRFACSLPREDGAMVLGADEYTSGRLDWYSFDQEALALTAAPAVLPTDDGKTVIPTPAEFPGMPNARWWQFEDAAVDLGSFRADATDVAKIIVAEFALLYGNNWFVVPYRQPVGSLAEVQGIIVTDVFGWRTSVAPATGSSGGVWTRWDFFSLSARDPSAADAPLGQHLFLPPALGHVLESEARESVAFIRDEMANLVWAVETRVPDGRGGSRDGAAFARQVRAALGDIERSLQAGAPVVAEAEPVLAEGQPVPAGPPLRYQLGTSVPENWIPFLPVHKPDQTRAIRLQRASTPRFFFGGVAPVRPITSILRPGLRDQDDGQDRPLYVNEEEVPRTGVSVEGTMQRARWFGGATLLWHGRRVTLGRGEGGSGLRFDLVGRRTK